MKNLQCSQLWLMIQFKNSVELKDNLAKLKDLEGVTGTMSIDKNHNPVKSALMIGLKDGKVKSVESVKP